MKSKRPCKKPMCPALVESGYCEAHASMNKQDEQWRGTPASRGYDHHWRKAREQQLKKDMYLCQHCLLAGRVTPACDVDHIIPISVAPARRLDISQNTQSLCRACHNKKTIEDKKRYT